MAKLGGEAAAAAEPGLSRFSHLLIKVRCPRHIMLHDIAAQHSMRHSMRPNIAAACVCQLQTPAYVIHDVNLRPCSALAGGKACCVCVRHLHDCVCAMQ